MSKPEIRQQLLSTCEEHLHKYKDLKLGEMETLRDFAAAYIDQVIALLNSNGVPDTEDLLQLLTPVDT